MKGAQRADHLPISWLWALLSVWLCSSCHFNDPEAPGEIPNPEPLPPTSIIVDTWPTWSPDGLTIAYYRSLSSSAGPPGIYIVHSDGTGNRLLFESAAWLSELRFSPDGSQLSFTFQSEIHLLEIGTGRVRQLTATRGNAMSADWSSDGLAVVITGPRVDGGGLRVIDVKSGAARVLTSGGRRLYGLDPRWSPAGEPIAFAMGDHEGNHEIYTIRSDGSDFRQLTNTAEGGGRADHPQWAYGGSHLLYLWRSLDSGRRVTRIIRSDGSEERTWPLLLLLYGLYDAISPDSRRVVTPGPQGDSTRIQDREVWVLSTRDLDDGGEESRRSLTSYHPVPVPD